MGIEAKNRNVMDSISLDNNNSLNAADLKVISIKKLLENNNKIIASLAFMMMASSHAAIKVHKCQDTNGTATYADVPCDILREKAREENCKGELKKSNKNMKTKDNPVPVPKKDSSTCKQG